METKETIYKKKKQKLDIRPIKEDQVEGQVNERDQRSVTNSFTGNLRTKTYKIKKEYRHYRTIY